jgi:hypothetical protein
MTTSAIVQDGPRAGPPPPDAGCHAVAMNPEPDLRTAIVVGPRPEDCDVVDGSERRTVGYAAPFASRAAELRPGHLVALAPGPDGRELVVWRWFDAVVVDASGEQVRLWEPAHGEVDAVRRRPGATHREGSRAYLSAGLPGAPWWLAGPADVAGQDADVERDEVRAFYAEHGLWERLV